MLWIVAEAEDEATATAVQRMLDDGASTTLPRRVRKSRWSPVELLDKPPVSERAAQRRAAKRLFRRLRIRHRPFGRFLGAICRGSSANKAAFARVARSRTSTGAHDQSS